MTFHSLPFEPRKIVATEARLNKIYEAAKLGLKGDALALASGMLPTEYRQLCELDPMADMAALKGKVVLLFFWAHWCPDCKAQVPAIASALDKYRSQGFHVVAPTQRFGYIDSGQDAAPDEELRHIEQVFDQSYAILGDQSVPVSDENHKNYGVSTTPTLVLVDREGIVRLYRPGNMSEDDLDAAIRELL